MATDFTPGPWRFCWNSHDVSKVPPTSATAWPNHKAGAGADRVDVSGPNTLANAHLIAAAPELYAVLAYLSRKGGLGLDVHERIDAALAKARGEQVSS